MKYDKNDYLNHGEVQRLNAKTDALSRHTIKHRFYVSKHPEYYGIECNAKTNFKKKISYATYLKYWQKARFKGEKQLWKTK